MYTHRVEKYGYEISGQSTTFADLLDDVFVHICIGSEVNIICPKPHL